MDRKLEKAIIMPSLAYTCGSKPDLIDEREKHTELVSEFI